MTLKGMQNIGIKNPRSFVYILLFFIPICLLRFHFDPVYIISWDTFGYYLYLPSYFIYHDPAFTDISWVQHIANYYHATPTLYQLREVPGGTYVNLYMAGMAIVYAPAFLAGHIIALIFHYPADGFSIPYQYAIAVEGLIVLLSALLMLRKVLLHFFSDNITLLVLITLTLGTNFLEMAYGNFNSPHGFIFLAYTFIIWLTIRWHAEQKLKYAVFLGLLIGWISLARPVEMVSLAIPFFWGIGSKYSLTGKIRFFFTQKSSLLLFVISAILAVLPQFLYWKTVAGVWFFNTYITGGEGMDLLSPHTLDFLFSFRKGWLIYTPVMAFALIGLVVVYRKNRDLFWPFFIFLFFFIYLYSSWSVWWYAFCFSQRVMIQAYPVLSLLLGFTIFAIAGLKRGGRTGLFGLVALLIVLNLFQTWQYTFAKVLDGSRMTPAYYLRIFGKTAVSDQDRKLLLIDRSNTDQDSFSDTTGYLKHKLATFDFEKKEAWYSYQSGEIVHKGKFAMKMDSSSIFTVPFKYSFNDLTKKDHAWLRISFFVYPVEDPVKDPFSLVVTTQYCNNHIDYKYRTANIENPVFKVVKGQWNQVVLDYLTPEIRSVKDTVSIYFWHRGKRPVYVDDVSIDVYSPGN